MTVTYSHGAPYQGAEDYGARCRRRLREGLGINSDGVEVILQLRQQVVALQARIRELEIQLSTYQAEQRTRVVQYRQSYYETSWHELSEDG